MVRDKSGELGSISIFLACPRFLQWSAIIFNKWKLKFVLWETWRWVSLITNPLNCWPPTFPLYRENLEQTPCVIQYISKIWNGWQKTKIPDHLGFSQNFENLTLKDSYVTCLQNIFCYFEYLRSAYKKKLDLFYKIVRSAASSGAFFLRSVGYTSITVRNTVSFQMSIITQLFHLLTDDKDTLTMKTNSLKLMDMLAMFNRRCREKEVK